VFGGDPWPYGIEGNKKTLEAAVECLYDQKMIERRVSIEELFLQSRGQNWKIRWRPIDVTR
jgi:4,5-dihydroxyphthalate decarboxylase